MKKWRVLILSLVLCLCMFSFVGCDPDQSNQQSEDTSGAMDTSGIEIDEGDIQDPFGE